MPYFIVACWLKVTVILNLAFYIDSCCVKDICREKGILSVRIHGNLARLR